MKHRCSTFKSHNKKVTPEETETLPRLFLALDKAKDILGEDIVLEIKSRLSSGSLKSDMFDSIIADTRNYVRNHELSYEEFIGRLNPPMTYIKPKDRALRTLIQALHDPLSKLLRAPFKSRKKKKT